MQRRRFIRAIGSMLAVAGTTGCSTSSDRPGVRPELGGQNDVTEDDGHSAVLSVWIYPEGYTDAELIALAEANGGYSRIFNDAIANGYIGGGAGDAQGNGSTGGGMESGGADSANTSNGDGGTWGGDTGGGEAGDSAGDSADTSNGDGGTWGGDTGGGGGTLGGDTGGGGGTWGDDGGDGGTWGGDSGGTTGSAVLPADPSPFRQAVVAQRMTQYAVTAGFVSLLDTPAPGPADVIALGILAFGMYMTSGTMTCDPCPAPMPPQVHEDHSHGNCEGAHWHHFKYNQAPAPDCTCYNQRLFGGCCGEGDPNAPC